MHSITIMGSAAAEGIPSRFCDCEVCRKARKNGGKDIRMTTAYSLNPRVRIDYGPDTHAEELRLNLNPALLKHIFFTHEHSDHLDTFAFTMRGKWYAHGYEVPLHIYGRPTVLQRMRSTLLAEGCDALSTLELHLLEHFKAVEIPEEDMTFYPLPANHYHIPGEAVFFAVRHGRNWLLIANDTGYPPEESWQWLESQKIRFDLVIADCTICSRDCRDGHMGGKWHLAFHERLRQIGAIDPQTRYVINHFSHNGGDTHADLEKFFGPHGIEVGYDGMALPYGE